MARSRVTRNLATSLLITLAGVAVGLVWVTRRQPANFPIKTKVAQPTLVRVVPPGGHDWFDGESELTAMPRVSSQRLGGPDDYESIGPDELSAAFLSRATESWSELDQAELNPDTELRGFQIATIEDLTVPELNDNPADFEIPRARPVRS